MKITFRSCLWKCLPKIFTCKYNSGKRKQNQQVWVKFMIIFLIYKFLILKKRHTLLWRDSKISVEETELSLKGFVSHWECAAKTEKVRCACFGKQSGTVVRRQSSITFVQLFSIWVIASAILIFCFKVLSSWCRLKTQSKESIVIREIVESILGFLFALYPGNDAFNLFCSKNRV